MWEWEKKIQKLYVLVVKARGGVKSAPAITLDFWLRLKKIYKMVLTSQQGWWFGYWLLLVCRPFLFLMNSMLSFSIVLLINCLLSLSPCLSLCRSCVWIDSMLLPFLTIFGHLGTIFCLLLWLVVSVEYLLKARTRACISMSAWLVNCYCYLLYIFKYSFNFQFLKNK